MGQADVHILVASEEAFVKSCDTPMAWAKSKVEAPMGAQDKLALQSAGVLDDDSAARGGSVWLGDVSDLRESSAVDSMHEGPAAACPFDL